MICLVSYFQKTLPGEFVDLDRDDIKLAQEREFECFKCLMIQLGKIHNWLSHTNLCENSLREFFANNKVWFLKSHGLNIGFAEIAKVSDREAQLNYFGILPEHRRTGLGQQLLEYVINDLARSGFQTIILRTCEFDDPSAARLYFKLGFKKIKETFEDISIE